MELAPEMEDLMLRVVGRAATSSLLDSTISTVAPSLWDAVHWSDVARLVTNVSLMTREVVLSSTHYSVRAVGDCKMPTRYFPGVELPEKAVLMERHTTVVTERMFHAICAVLQCNGFGVHDAADASVAIGLFPSASYWNHDCNPNLARVMVGRTATFFALRDIAEGEPLTISYADVEAPCSERRYRMLVTYRFYCQCARCAGSAQLFCDRCSDCAARGYMRPLVQSDGDVRAECTVCRKLKS